MSEYIIHIEDAKTLYVNTDFPFPFDAYIKEEIVRCRDCKHGYELEDGTYDCMGPLVEYWDYYYDKPKQNIMPPDGFCSHGVRRNNRLIRISGENAPA